MNVKIRNTTDRALMTAGVPRRGFSLKWYQKLFSDYSIWEGSP